MGKIFSRKKGEKLSERGDMTNQVPFVFNSDAVTKLPDEGFSIESFRPDASYIDHRNVLNTCYSVDRFNEVRESAFFLGIENLGPLWTKYNNEMLTTLEQFLQYGSKVKLPSERMEELIIALSPHHIERSRKSKRHKDEWRCYRAQFFQGLMRLWFIKWSASFSHKNGVVVGGYRYCYSDITRSRDISLWPDSPIRTLDIDLTIKGVCGHICIVRDDGQGWYKIFTDTWGNVLINYYIGSDQDPVRCWSLEIFKGNYKGQKGVALISC